MRSDLSIGASPPADPYSQTRPASGTNATFINHPSPTRRPIQPSGFHKCYDGDTCTFTLPGLPDVFGDRFSIRLVGIDTPEIRGHCQQEKRLATQARDFLNDQLMQAGVIEIRHTARDKYFRVLAEIFADGQDMSEILIQRGLAVPYHGGTKTKDWCSEKP
jgi:micrococcal nuclease